MFSTYIRVQVVDTQGGAKGTWRSVFKMVPLVSSKFCVVLCLLDAKGTFRYSRLIS